MGEIESPTGGAALGDEQWQVFITLDVSGPMSGQPINPLTNDNLFDDFDAALARAVSIRNNPHDTVDYPFEDGQSVNVKITSYDP